MTHLRRTSVPPLPLGAALFALLHSNLPNQGWFSRSLSHVSRFQVIIPLPEALRGSKDGNHGAKESKPCPIPFPPSLGVLQGPRLRTGALPRLPAAGPGPLPRRRSQPCWLAQCEASSLCHLRSTHAFWRPWPALRPMQKSWAPFAWDREMRPGREGEKWLGSCVRVPGWEMTSEHTKGAQSERRRSSP